MNLDLERLLKRAEALSLVSEIANYDTEPPVNNSDKVVDGMRNRERKKKKFSEQYLKYLIVIDFEATCWKERRVSPNEIIGKQSAVLCEPSLTQFPCRIPRRPLQSVHPPSGGRIPHLHQANGTCEAQ